MKDLLTDEDENNEHVRMSLKVDHKEAVGVKKELILKMIRKNPRIRLTFLKFEKKCFKTFIKKLLERVPSPDDESILEKRTEECLTPQPAIVNNFLPVDTNDEELTKEWREISNLFNIPPDDPSLAMNLTRDDVSKVLEKQQSLTRK